MRQSFPLFSLVNIFFTWKSSLCVKKQKTKLPRLNCTSTPASETPNSYSGQGSEDGIFHLFHSSQLAIEIRILVDFLSAFFFFLNLNICFSSGLFNIALPKQNTCTIKGRERELGNAGLCHCSTDWSI